MAVTWNYDGAGNLTATLTGTTLGNDYWLYCPQQFSTVVDTAAGSSLTLTATDVIFGSAGEEFAAYVITNAPEKTVYGSNIFVYGTASTTGVGFPVTWAYDGASTITASFAASTTDSYSLEGLFYAAGGSIFDEASASDTGTGTVNLTLTTSQPPNSGSSFTVILFDEFGASLFDWRAVSTRMFVGGTANSGTAGSPTTGGTDVGFVDEVVPSEPTGAGGVRVMVAFDDTTLEPDPEWTDVTAISPSLVAAFSIDRGRAFELDRTDAGTANVRISDRDGVLDPTNASGPYYGLIEPLLQIRLDLWDPVAEAWSTLYRGYIEDYDYVVEPFTHQDKDDVTVGLNRLEIGCVDAFAILTAIEMQPGAFGDDPTTAGTPDIASAKGIIFYDNKRVNLRIEQVLGNAGWPVALTTVFTGNVYVQESSYSPGDNILQPIQDAADSEFPGVANVYVSRLGIVTFHGRLARFDPEGVSAEAGEAWPFNHWKAGDEKAVLASISDTAQVRSLSFNRGLSKIINQATATPTGILEEDIADQVSTDAGSVATYGFRSWSAENLLTLGGTDDGLDANDETKLYADFMVAAFSAPRNRITNLTFRSMNKDDERAAPNWALLCGAEISDLIDVTVTTPGEGGFNLEPFFIEGVHYEVGPLNGEYANVTLSLDLSPQVYYLGGAFGSGGLGDDVEPGAGEDLAVSITGPAYEDETLTAGATGGV